MADASYEVVYRAIGDFANAIAGARAMRSEIRKLKDEQGRSNAAEAKASTDSSKRSKKRIDETIAEFRQTKKVISEREQLLTRANRGAINLEETFARRRKQIIAETEKSVNKTRETISKEDTRREIHRRHLIKMAEEAITRFRLTALHDQRRAAENHARAVASIDRRIYSGVQSAARRARADFDRESKATEKIRVRNRIASERELSRISKRGFGELMTDAAKAFVTVEKGSSVFDRVSASVRSMDRAPGAGGGGVFGGLISSMGALGEASTKMLGKLSFWPVVYGLVISAISPLITILGALGGAILGVANVIGSLSGALAAVPGLFAAAATSVAALMVALAPVQNVFKAFGKWQEAAAEGARDNSAAQEQMADRMQTASRAVSRAQRAMGEAQDDARKATQRLVEARREELRNLQDLRGEVARSALTEERATLSLQEAQDEYNKTLADPHATLLDRKNALLRVKEAEWDLYDVRLKNQRQAADLQEAERKGVEGSDSVVAAKEAIADANQRQADAAVDLADAQRDLARAQREQAAGGSSALKAQQEFEAQMAKLSPSTQKVVRGILDMKDAWNDIQRNVQESIFSKLTGDLDNVKGLLPTVNELLTDAGGALGEVASKGIKMISSGPWKADFSRISKANIGIINNVGDALLSVVEGFKDIAVAAIPFTTWISEGIKKFGQSFADWAKSGRESGRIASALTKTAERMKVVWSITKNIASAIFSFVKASGDFGDWMLDRIDKTTKKWAESAKAQEQQGSKFKKYLEDIKPLLSELAGLVGDFVGGFADLASDKENIDNTTKSLKTMREELGGPLKDIIDTLGKQGVLDSIVKGFADLLDAIDRFLQSGGGGALKVFIETLTGLINALSVLISLPGVSTVLSGIAIGFAALAAATAVGKFTGIFKLVDALKWIIRNKGDLKGALGEKFLGGKTRDTGLGDSTVGDSGLRNAATALSKAASDLSIAASRLSAAAAGDAVDGAPVPGGDGKGGKKTPGKGRAGRLGKIGAGAGAAGIAGGVAAAATAAILLEVDYGSDLMNRMMKGENVSPAEFIPLLSPLTIGLMAAFGPVDTFFKETLPNHLNTVFTNLWERLPEEASRTFSNILEAATVGLFGPLAIKGGEFFMGLINGARNAWVAMFNSAIENVWAPLGRWISGLWSGVYESFMRNIGSPIANFFRELPSKIGDAFSGAAGWLRERVDSIKNFLGLGSDRTPHGASGGWISRDGFNRAPKKAAGGWIGGTGFDSTPIMANQGEFLVSSARANNGQMPKILEGINTGQINSTDILAGLNGAIGSARTSASVPSVSSVNSGLSQPVSSGNTVTTRFGDIIINNPKQERASDSIQRRVQMLTI